MSKTKQIEPEGRSAAGEMVLGAMEAQESAILVDSIKGAMAAFPPQNRFVQKPNMSQNLIIDTGNIKLKRIYTNPHKTTSWNSIYLIES